jgi:peptidyl-prolyl cis-trans isomerase D
MALISTLRKRMGKIVVGLVAFSMVAFIATDLLQSNSALMGGSDRQIAEISGNEISYDTFNQKVDELASTFALNYGRTPSSDDLTNIRKEAWNALVIENAYQEQFDKLGIIVTDEEVIDMVQGNNISPQIRQFFTDPNTGQFSRDAVIATLKNLASAPAQQRQAWYSFEATLRPSRQIEKYNALFAKTEYVTEAEAKALYTAQNSSASVEYLYVPFFSVSDSAVKVTDSELKSYLSAHEQEYQKEESRSIQYVVFDVVASAEDSAYVLNEITALRDGLSKAQNDSVYVSINSETPNGFQPISNPDLIPESLKIDGQIAPIGTVTAPILAGNRYTIIKLSGIDTDGEAFVKGSHILIKPSSESDEDKAAAKKKAEDILAKLKKGGDFTALAAENSEDRSNANNGGDLGWFGENGGFVQEFKDAAFGFKGKGLLPSPVETSFGYHIIKIDEPKTTTSYKIAKIEKELFAGDDTMNEIYRTADILASESKDANELKTNAEAKGFTVRTAANIGKNDTRLGALNNARAISSWAYNKASKGTVSEVFELDNTYVVAGLTSIQPKGTANLEQVKGEIQVKVTNQKKAELIIGKLKGLSSQDLSSIKSSYGSEARTGNADLTLSSNSFPNVGFAPEAVGVAFALKEGQKSPAFATDNGVVIISLVSKSAAQDQESYSDYTAQVKSTRAVRGTTVANFPLSFYPLMVSQRVDNALKEYAEIEDNRYKFY